MAEPRRPWVVDVLDAAGVAMLKDDETSRLGQWVQVLASDLAWAATPSDAFLSDRVAHVDDDHPWEVRETRGIGPLTYDLRESDIAGELLLHRPRRPAFTCSHAPVRTARGIQPDGPPAMRDSPDLIDDVFILCRLYSTTTGRPAPSIPRVSIRRL